MPRFRDEPHCSQPSHTIQKRLVIRLNNLTRKFGQVIAVHQVSFSVQEGELIALLGGSGSGKTTTLRMINRLIEPTEGLVEVDGADNSALSPHELRRKIGYVFQKIGLFPRMTVAENISITPRLLGWDPKVVAQRVDELLELVELPPDQYRHRLPHALSGGQQQRVGVARALAAKPRVMLLDEPFGALDPLTRDRLQQSFQAIRKRLHLTAIFVTHDMMEAMVLADRIAVMEEGRLVQIGSPQELLEMPATEYVRQLVSTPRRQAEAIERLLNTPVSLS